MQPSKFYSDSFSEVFDNNSTIRTNFMDEDIAINTFNTDNIPEYNSSQKIFPERNLTENNPDIQDFINKIIDGRAGTVNSFESSRMES